MDGWNVTGKREEGGGWKVFPEQSPGRETERAHDYGVIQDIKIIFSLGNFVFKFLI